ncbi:MAG: hypothetical protein OXF04_00145, partial [bacterium]|nr:hypothetical protein [bacterium]
MTFEARFDLNDLDWTHMEGGPEFDYLVDFDLAVLGSQPENGTLDMLVRFAPHSHFLVLIWTVVNSMCFSMSLLTLAHLVSMEMLGSNISL